jgi:hypothetical protein
MCLVTPVSAADTRLVARLSRICGRRSAPSELARTAQAMIAAERGDVTLPLC